MAASLDQGLGKKRIENQRQDENQVRAFIENFERDHDLLKSLFREELRKSEALEHKADTIDSRRYFLSHTLEEALAESHGEFISLVRLSVQNLKELLDSGKIPHAVHALIHEWCHTVANRLLFISGYETWLGGNNPFNEGVTHMIGDELFLSYAQHHNNFGITPSVAKTVVAGLQEKGGYSGSILLVRAFINTVAKRTGTTPDVVWNAIKKHYFTDGFSREVRSALKELFDDQFVREIAFMPSAGSETVEPSVRNISIFFERYFDQPENQDIVNKVL